MLPVTISTEELLHLAVDHHKAGRLAIAASFYQRIIALQPWNANAIHLLGLILTRTPETAAGGAWLMTRALRLDPLLEPAYINLTNFYRGRNDLEAAIAWLERGVEALPNVIVLWETLCTLRHNQAVRFLETEDRETVRQQLRRCRAHVHSAPYLTQTLYELLEPQIRIAMLIDDTETAVAYIALRNRFDFAKIPAGDIDIFTLTLSDFFGWSRHVGARTVTWQAAATLPTEATRLDYPDYMHPFINQLPALAAPPLGVAIDVPVEVVQGFYVKDNYESFVIYDRQHMLCENHQAVIRGAHVPLIGVTPAATAAGFRLPRPLYRHMDIDEPIIFVPSTPNYWHFMVEVLPMLMVREQAPELCDHQILLFDVRPYQYEMLTMVGIAPEQILDARQLLEPEVKQVVYRLRQAAIPSQVPYPIAYHWLRSRLLPQIRHDHPTHPRRIFLSRRGAYPKHRIANDSEVGALLERHGFTVVLPETLSILETIEMIAGAEIVVAPIGAGTANHVFLPPYGAWVHLNSPDFFHPESTWNRQMGNQATLCGHFRHVTGRFIGDPASFPTRDVDRLEIPIEIDLCVLEQLIVAEEQRLARSLQGVANISE